MLTDEVAQVHRSPGFITSALLGKTDDNIPIKGTGERGEGGRSGEVDGEEGKVVG